MLNPPSGCRFRTRCPFAMEICAVEPPPRAPIDGGGSAACHLHTHGPKLGGRSVKALLAGRVEDSPSVMLATSR
jgi:hypothetical protein